MLNPFPEVLTVCNPPTIGMTHKIKIVSDNQVNCVTNLWTTPTRGKSLTFLSTLVLFQGRKYLKCRIDPLSLLLVGLLLHTFAHCSRY